MRGFLDWLYRASGALAAAFLVAICAIVLLQVGANLVDETARLLGAEPPGLVIPSYAEFAGFFLAASSFLALAYTLRTGGHIRVSLVVQHVPARVRHGLEIWCVAAGGAVTGYFTWYTLLLTLESLEYGDLSPGMVPVALWIPQSSMALGLAILTVAFVDEFVGLLRGAAPSYEAAKPEGSAE
jgi:TRAP-type C4-dicarboxylate transport system permease small subunit